MARAFRTKVEVHFGLTIMFIFNVLIGFHKIPELVLVFLSQEFTKLK